MVGILNINEATPLTNINQQDVLEVEGWFSAAKSVLTGGAASGALSLQPPNPIIRFENAMRPNCVRPLSATAATRLQTKTIV